MVSPPLLLTQHTRTRLRLSITGCVLELPSLSLFLSWCQENLSKVIHADRR
ncbi:unnamed protein product, partial [Staurois parvus]